jgi:regulator of cell morphogenesis and NO signaling
VLFPWLRRLERPTEIQSGPTWSVRRPISCMVHDHDDAGKALATLRRLTNDYTPPDDACATYRSTLSTLEALEADTHRHIHKENNILFPAGVAAEDARRK